MRDQVTDTEKREKKGKETNGKKKRNGVLSSSTTTPTATLPCASLPSSGHFPPVFTFFRGTADVSSCF
uniref:Niemann-Pick C1 protein n=1 Tax=Rhizophora mucronata TaxID=61149 RepID=A0A2P2KIA7_RHIMU